VNLISVDRTTLPAALLPEAKEHMRVRHVRDDTLIATYLSMAIAAVERRGNINLNPATYEIDGFELRLDDCNHAAGAFRYRLPVNNVSAISDLIQSGGTDQAGQYTVTQSDAGGSGNSYITGPSLYGYGWTLKAEVGIDDPLELDPAVLSCLYRIAAAYYEARESNAPVFVDDFTSELLQVWRPGT
jgi:hypothetical protein